MADPNSVIVTAESWVTLLGVFVSVVLAIVGGVWSLAWWLSKQFTAMRQVVFAEVNSLREMLTSKLDYHEQHDDKRFGDIRDSIGRIRDDMWEMRVVQAARNTNFKEKE